MSFVTAAIIGGAGVASSVIGANAAGKAANTQVNAANYAANLNKQAADEALAFQKQQYSDSQTNLAPWLESGKAALAQQNQLLTDPNFNSAYPAFDFKPGDFTQDPGYAFTLAEGQKALDRSAAARGGALGGAAIKAATRYNQNMAANQYGDVYNRALQKYQTNFNVASNERARRFNELSSVAGTGQVTANQLNSAGQQAAANSGNILMTSANQQGNLATDAANARASGYVGSANSWNNALSGMGNNFLNAYMMSKSNYNPGLLPPLVGTEEIPINAGLVFG